MVARFLVDQTWADDRGSAWRSVTNHSTMQARRDADVLDLRLTSGDTAPRSYRLTPLTDCYLATKEN